MQNLIAKNTRTVILTLCSLLLGVPTLNAQTIQVNASFSCGEWVRDRKVDGLHQTIKRRWLLGYLSGLAVANSKDILLGTDNESIFLWIDNYCQANPLKESDAAGLALYKELVKSKRL